MLLLGTLTNQRGLTVSAVWMSVAVPRPDAPTHTIVDLHDDRPDMLAEVGVGLSMTNPGAVAASTR